MFDRDDEPAQVSAPLQFGQFSLRALFIAVTVIAVLCGMYTLLPFAWSGSLTLLGLLIALHVAGNVVDTTLRDAPRAELPPPSSGLPVANDPAGGSPQTTAISQVTSERPAVEEGSEGVANPPWFNV